MKELAFVLCVTACTATDPADPGDPDPSAPEPVLLTFPPLDVASGQEILSICQSIRLDNDEPILVNAVHMEAGPAWHHSNWFFVPEDTYAGPDGTWDCRDRDFDTLQTGLVGGVVFAQSTQARTETQRFSPGAAVEIPPRSRIVGEVHLINASDADLATAIELTLEPISRDDFTTPLRTATLVYYDLAIPPMQRSRFTADCDLATPYGAPLDFSVHYVLPHYHGLGRSMKLEVIGGQSDGTPIYENESAIGEPLGGALEPHFDLTGAERLRMSCTFDNTGESTVEWGFADGEMCVALLFVDGPLKWVAAVQDGSAPTPSPDEIESFEGPCQVLAFPG